MVSTAGLNSVKMCVFNELPIYSFYVVLFAESSVPLINLS